MHVHEAVNEKQNDFKLIGLQNTLQIGLIANASGKSIFNLRFLSLDATEQYTSIVDNRVDSYMTMEVNYRSRSSMITCKLPKYPKTSEHTGLNPHVKRSVSRTIVVKQFDSVQFYMVYSY